MSNQAIEDALIEARIDEIKTTRDHGFNIPADTEVGQHLAAPMSMTSTAADRAVIYDTETGEPREVLVNMLAKTLKKRRDGKMAFSVTPVKEFRQGQVPCWFNPASAMYATVQDVPGLRGFTCASAHLASEFDAEMHAKRRHSQRYLMVEDWRQRKEREDTKALQERQIEAMMAMARANSGIPATANPAPVNIFYCTAEGCGRFFDSDQGLKIHRSKEQHGG